MNVSKPEEKTPEKKLLDCLMTASVEIGGMRPANAKEAEIIGIILWGLQEMIPASKALVKLRDEQREVASKEARAG